jgi:hypothetical protein
MKLYKRLDVLIVAEDERDARRLLREQRDLDSRDLRLFPVRQVRRSVELCNTSNHDERAMYTPSEVVKTNGRGLIPNVG